jgi:hypothetical protein
VDDGGLGMESSVGATSTIGEVRYEDEGVRLLVAVAADLSKDGVLSDHLTDILATAPDRKDALDDIHALAERIGLNVHVEHDGDGDAVILEPLQTF